MSVREHLDPCHYQGLKSALLASALGYAARGMYVFPVKVGRKQPLWNRWESRATRDPNAIRRVWGRAPYNVGVACGPSGLVVIDLDLPKPEDEGPPEPYPEVNLPAPTSSLPSRHKPTSPGQPR